MCVLTKHELTVVSVSFPGNKLIPEPAAKQEFNSIRRPRRRGSSNTTFYGFIGLNILSPLHEFNVVERIYCCFLFELQLISTLREVFAPFEPVCFSKLLKLLHVNLQ